MNIRLQIIIGCLIVLGLLHLVRMTRREKIEFRFALPWAGMALILLLLDIFPGIPVWLARLMGIATPSNMLFLLGMLFLLMLVFMLSTALSNAQKKIKQMAQEIALMKTGTDGRAQTPAAAGAQSGTGRENGPAAEGGAPDGTGLPHSETAED